MISGSVDAGGSLLVELVRSANGGDRTGTFETAVETFSRVHSNAEHALHGDDWYRGRIPLTFPNVGQQFAFEVALDSCTGCKACVAACHSLNGLDVGESWRRVGGLFGVGAATAPAGAAMTTVAEQRTVTSACHHCVDPGCLSGCPVNAYEKDAVTGAVIHLDDQCIGCSYCTMTCPYEVPQFNERLGIVRKCDLCHGRLAVGESPACVQGCPNGAIRIAIIDKSSVIAATRSNHANTLVPGCADSSLSVPSTRYVSSMTSLDGLAAEDNDVLVVAPEHDPLAAMLVLTQVGVGLVGADAVLRLIDAGAGAGRTNAVVGVAMALVGMLTSFGHLGRPTKAWRVVLGIGHSWLSREAVALGAFAAVGGLQVLAPSTMLGVTAFAIGLIAVGTSVKVYAVTGRAWWSQSRVASRFGLTTLVAAFAGAAVWIDAPLAGVGTAIAMAVCAVTLIRPSPLDANRSLRRTALLLRGQLRRRAGTHLVVGLLASLVTAAGSALGSGPTKAVGLGLFVLGALVERTLFFRAVAPARMPGSR